ncbi:amidohydrolase family protein, partial [Candidatus Woesearchaeota archaeon]|nr:amidohydrolase family protein [Candidatus Woesearchaeota archaeon]
MKLLIKQGSVIDPANKVNDLMDVLVEEGKISKIAKTIREKADEVIDARGKIVCPGLIDMHVHAREPGFEAKETIATCAKAAARGGFTSIVVMPNTNPPTDSK